MAASSICTDSRQLQIHHRHELGLQHPMVCLPFWRRRSGKYPSPTACCTTSSGARLNFQGNEGSRFENISFANLVLQQVTGPIHISLGPRTRQNQNVDEGLQSTLPKETRPPAVARNISFSNIHGTVTTNPP
jgi:hypothetical protein